MCFEIMNGAFSSALSIVASIGLRFTSGLAAAVTGLMVSSPGSVKTLSLEDSWLGGVGISVTTRPLFAKRHESVTSSGGSWIVCGVVGVWAGVVVDFVVLDRKDPVVVTHGFAVIAVSLRHSGSTLPCVS